LYGLVNRAGALPQRLGIISSADLGKVGIVEITHSGAALAACAAIL
jgi:hypothetical protein